MDPLALLSCLSLLLVAATAQQPKPCVSPPLMTGGVTLVMSPNITSTGMISYDALGQRMRLRNFGIVGNKTVQMDQLMLFRENVFYDIDWISMSCVKRPLDTSFIPMQVPFDAKLMGQVFLGSSSSWGMGVLVNNWYGDLPNNGRYMSVFTEIGCIPMTFTYYTPSYGWMFISTFNWVLGNTNPMDFVPPFICANSKLELSETPLNMFTAMESLAMKTIKHLPR